MPVFHWRHQPDASRSPAYQARVAVFSPAHTGPQRGYLVYVPAGLTDRWTFRRHPLLVLIHGCRQTPEDIAAGTRIAHLADQNRFLVLLPRQHERANSWGCWNWFDRATSRGWGETAIAPQIRAVRRAYRINKKRVFVAGMSSGGGLLRRSGIRRLDLLRACSFTRGSPAAHPLTPLGVLAEPADTDVLGIAPLNDADPALPVRLSPFGRQRRCS